MPRIAVGLVSADVVGVAVGVENLEQAVFGEFGALDPRNAVREDPKAVAPAQPLEQFVGSGFDGRGLEFGLEDRVREGLRIGCDPPGVDGPGRRAAVGTVGKRLKLLDEGVEVRREKLLVAVDLATPGGPGEYLLVGTVQTDQRPVDVEEDGGGH